MAKALTFAQLLEKQKNEGHEVTLPDSGLRIKLRPVDVTRLVRNGVIPISLYQKAMDGLPDFGQLDDPDSPENVERLFDVIDSSEAYEVAIFNAGFIDATIVPNDVKPNREKNEIHLDDLPPGDRRVLVGLFHQPVHEWERFLSRQTKSLPPVVGQSSVSQDAE